MNTPAPHKKSRNIMFVEPSKSLLGADKDVGDVLVLAEQRDVKENLKRLAVRRQHNKLSLPTVQGLGCFVGTLAELLVVGSLLDQVEDLGGQCLLGQGVSLGVHFLGHLVLTFLSALLPKQYGSRLHGFTEVSCRSESSNK